jgi:hypothetical protein
MNSMGMNQGISQAQNAAPKKTSVAADAKKKWMRRI